MVRFGAVWYGFGSVWCGLMRFCALWCGLVRFDTVFSVVNSGGVRFGAVHFCTRRHRVARVTPAVVLQRAHLFRSCSIPRHTLLSAVAANTTTQSTSQQHRVRVAWSTYATGTVAVWCTAGCGVSRKQGRKSTACACPGSVL